jgi:hypothetical protein
MYFCFHDDRFSNLSMSHNNSGPLSSAGKIELEKTYLLPPTTYGGSLHDFSSAHTAQTFQ